MGIVKKSFVKKFVRTTFPKCSGSYSYHDGSFMMRFGKSCCIGFCEFWGFLPCYYDPIWNKIVFKPSTRWILNVFVSTLLKTLTFLKFIYNSFKTEFTIQDSEVTTRLFMLKLNLFTGFVHLHTAWKGAEMFAVTNQMSEGFEKISLNLRHKPTRKTGYMMCVFFGMLALLSISTIHPFLMDCNFHFIEEIVGSCKGQRAYDQKFLLEVITQFFSGADLCGSILPYGIILNEFILMPREILTATLIEANKLENGNPKILLLLNVYENLTVIFSHFNQTFRLFMPALVNFLMTSVSFTLSCMILRGNLAIPIRATLIVYFAMIFLRIVIIMDQASKITMDASENILIMRRKTNARNKWVRRRLRSLRPLEMQIGNFHAVSTYVMFVCLNAILSYTASLLLTIGQNQVSGMS